MNRVRVVTTPHELRDQLGGDAPGLVPTMGALHAGHLALIERSVAENACTVVSIFVNPLQFNAAEDLAGYPRSFERDVELAVEAGTDLIFAPSEAVLYPTGFATSVSVSGLTERWEGAARPGHFQGVTTVVAKLFSIVRPAHAYFGEKDFQQLVVIRRMHADLNLPGVVVGCPTVRDDDGLALSSRNVRMTEDERRRAAVLPRALMAMRERANTGERRAGAILALGLELLSEEPSIELDYLAIVDPDTLEPVDELIPGTRALLAARVGVIRLIDNVALLEPVD